MMNYKKISCTVGFALLLLLTACSSDKDKVDAKQPATVVQNPTTLKVQWKGHTGNGTGKADRDFAPVLADGHLYTASQNGTLVAYDAETGRVLWQQKTANALTSGPAVGEGKLFVNDNKGELRAFNADNGASLFHVTLPNKSFAAPAYSHGVVVVKTVDEQLRAFNAQDGHVMWNYASNAPSMILEGGSSPVIDDGIVIQGGADGDLTLVTLDKGQLIWQRPVVQPNGVSDIARMVDIDANPIANGNIIYVGSYQGNITAIDKYKAEPMWQHPLSTRSGLAYGDDALFVTDTQGQVWAFNPNTGKVLWRQDKLSGRTLTAPTVVGDNIVVADDAGDVHWLNQADGHFEARVRADKNGVSSTPVAEGNTVFVLSNTGDVFAYQL